MNHPASFKASLKQKELSERIQFCRDLLQEVQPLILEGFQNPKISREFKADGSDVTEIDRRVEELIRNSLLKNFPGERIVGEEFGSESGSSPFTWYIDPIDGTKSYVSGVPLFGSMIGILENDYSLLGCVEFPALGESMFAYRGGGAFWTMKRSGIIDTRKCQVSSVKKLHEAFFTTTSKDEFMKSNRISLYDRLTVETAMTRGWGDCFGHLLVATGRVDIMIDATCADWDCVPIQVIVEESGGSFFDIYGKRSCLGKSMISTNQHLQAAIKELLVS